MGDMIKAKRVVITCHPSIARRLRLSGGAVDIEVLPFPEGEEAWALSIDADVMVTQTSDWKGAPEVPPQGWSKNLSWCHILSAGIDAYPRWLLDLPIATCGRGTSSVAIAEYVLAAILHHEKRLDAVFARSPADWQKRALGTVAGKTIGLLGIGSIGTEVARRALAFDARVIAFRRSGAGSGLPGVEVVSSLQELAMRSDHLVLAAPLTDETRHVIDAGFLSQALPGLHIINISRGGLINDDDLIRALDSGQISAATLDVTTPEPPPEGHVFYSHPKIRLTPHISWYSQANDQQISQGIQANLDRYLKSEPLLNVVDKGRGY